MPTTLIALTHAWDQALTTGHAGPGLLESLQMEGMAEIVMAMAADADSQAGPCALMCAGLLGQLPGGSVEFDEVPGANEDPERHLTALAGVGLVPSRWIDRLRALTTHRGHLSPAAARSAALAHAWACRALGWPQQAERTLQHPDVRARALG